MQKKLPSYMFLKGIALQFRICGEGGKGEEESKVEIGDL